MRCRSGSCSCSFSGVDDRGKTMTAFGSHEWLANATVGETHMPIGVSAGVVSVNVFVVN